MISVPAPITVHRAFEVTGSAPTTVGPVSAEAGSELSLRCPAGSMIVNIPQATYGADGCSSGGAQYLAEALCLLKEACKIQVLDAALEARLTDLGLHW